MSKNSFTRTSKIPDQKEPTAVFEALPGHGVVPYNENLLERARTQWQFGDWQSLAALNRETLQNHPDRAKLALLAAAGRLQIGLDTEGRQLLRLANDWGASKKLLSQILIAGVHNSLGRAAAISNQHDHALQHFHNSVLMGTPESEARLLASARTQQQYLELGLPVVHGLYPAKVASLAQPIKPDVSDENLNFNKEIEVLRAHFDKDFYILNNPDVEQDGIDPLEHYCRFGWKENRDPHPDFSTAGYLRANKDVLEEGKNPFLHWVVYGRAEGRKGRPNALCASPGLFAASKNTILVNCSVDIVVPVFNAYEELCECLDRLQRFTSVEHRVILINDASTDSRIKVLCENFVSKRSGSVLINYSTKQGFVELLNHAFKLAKDHLVVINSGTFVPEGWLDRLLVPILNDEKVATNTPMTNNGELASIPIACKYVVLQPGAPEKIDSVASGFCPLKTVSELPAAPGFCMALSKHWLDTLGGLDVAFGSGHGALVDWCQRAIKQGGKNLLTGALFVEQRVGIALGSENKYRIDSCARTVSQRYPRYELSVQKFHNDDPAINQRLALGLAMIGAEGVIPIYLGHRLGGGAEIWLDNVVSQRLKESQSSVVIRDGDIDRHLLIELHTVNGVLKVNVDINEVSDYIRLLPKKEIIYSCLVSSRNPLSIFDIIFKTINASDRLRILFHDYFPLCPSYTLIGADDTYCKLPDNNSCESCYLRIKEKTGSLSENIKEWRAKWGGWLERADEVVVFSESSKELVLRVWRNLVNKIVVKPHQIEIVPRKIEKTTSECIVLGVLGSMVYHKGAKVLHDIAAEAEDSIKIVLLGEIDPVYSHKNILVHGRFNQNEITDLAEYYSISCWLIPSICPETYSFSTRECLATGVPVYAFDLGAQAEALMAHPHGRLLPLNASPADILKIIYNDF